MSTARRPAAPRARRALLLGAGAFALGACANLFGLDTYRDAPETLCDRCAAIPDCEARLNAKLDAAPDAEVAAWLSLYEELGCASSLCDATTLECFYRAPDNQAKDGEPCLHSEGCEDFDFDAPEKGGACCAGDDAEEGVCCAGGCLTCGEKLTSFLDAGDGKAQLCRSHEEAWANVVGCRGKGCLLKCTPPFLDDGAKKACAACIAEACQQEVDACLKNVGR